MSTSPVGTGVAVSAMERRKYPRFRFSAPIIVRLANAPQVRGMSVEISESGMSAMVGADLKVGDAVELEPVGGGICAAVVRRSFGKLCGFEFVNLSPEQARKIREACTMLPLYYSETLDLWKRCGSD
jgi:c-di-GMP-binding flagellar brake protein YcgR